MRFDKLGAVKLGCNIHDWMSGVILVVPTPYFAMTDADGAFTLRDLPPGTYGVVAWHEGSKAQGRRHGADASRVGAGAAPVAFTLDVVPRPARAPGGAARRYE